MWIMIKVKKILLRSLWNRKIVSIFLLTTTFAVHIGCKEKQEDNEWYMITVRTLNRISENSNLTEYERKTALAAVELWKNNAIDVKPVLISAFISQAEGVEEPNISIIFYDEDKDVLGIGFRESRKIDDGTNNILIETYPVYNYNFFPSEVFVGWLGFNIRKANDRKNENLWQEYLNENVEQMNIEAIGNTPIPPVIVSIPEPKSVDVEIWIYDRAGNESEPIKLLNRLDG